MFRMVGAAAVLFCSAFSALAASSSFEFTVAAGTHERKNVPVRVPIPAGQIANGKIASVTLAGADGKSISAQLSKSSLIHGDGPAFYFILPHLAAGESLSLKATLSTEAAPSAEGFAWHDVKGNHADLFFGNRPMLGYYYHRYDNSSEESRVQT